jgi:hypothetical protein
MPTTYTLISSTVIGSNMTTVTISSIPSTYTDLNMLIVAKSSFVDTNWDQIRARYNGDTATNYSDRDIYAQEATVNNASAGTANQQFNNAGMYIPASGDSAGTATWSNINFYIPNYTSATNKPINHYTVKRCDNNNNDFMTLDAGLWRNSATISSISFFLGFENFLAGSAFYLYGIKKN